MRYVEIWELVDGHYKRAARVWEDGRFLGDQEWRKTVESSYLKDPETGEKATRGMPLLRAVAESFNNVYVSTSMGEDESE